MPSGSTRRAAPVLEREGLGSAERQRGRRRRPAPDWGGDELFDHVPRHRFARDPDEHPRSAASADVEPLPAALPLSAGRSDHDGMPARPFGIQKRARPGSVEQRITASPDRIMAWAFALGLLLILMAVATSL